MPLFAILTLFPEALEAYARASILGLAQEKGLVRILLVDFRDFTRDRHRTVDDRPFGGGPGMVLKAEPIVECVEWLERRHGPFRKLIMCPAGEPFRQSRAEALALEERILLLCGRYEGFDERILTLLDLEEVSVGDFVLSGGELAALSVTEAVTRLVPGVLGDERSALEDSFRADGPLDHSHYTRPRVFRGEAVPEVLISGDHARIQRWRESQALARTRARTREQGPDRTGRMDRRHDQPEQEGASPAPEPRRGGLCGGGRPKGGASTEAAEIHHRPDAPDTRNVFDLHRTETEGQRTEGQREAEPRRLRNPSCT